eukprot:TRINITY_DN7874_c0_g1_i8.p1 TRINITY_DN7874_c0_g1~~TRINITY_DN7874_c0_g1_i8.p1  ORF type:complete len:493 (-),score=68.25 TRINITY_DN7874_c0_g1_i8:660-2138(-)
MDQRSDTIASFGFSKLGFSCSRVSVSSVFGGGRKSLSTMQSMSPSSGYRMRSSSKGPFAGLVVCVTGLSKEARKQVQVSTERLGGQYSPDLHPQCTHLVVQSFSGRKFEHALKYGLRRGLFVVTLTWFVDSLKYNERLDETLYSVDNMIQQGLSLEELSKSMSISSTAESSCLPIMSNEDSEPLSLTLHQNSRPYVKDASCNASPLFSGNYVYIDPAVSSELQRKVVEASNKEGARCIDYWYIGCGATHVVCEGTSVQKYVGYATNLVTPLWILKTVRERFSQRLVHFSADLARQVALLLDNSNSRTSDMHGFRSHNSLATSSTHREYNIEEREQKVNAAKASVRRRRGPRMQPCRTIPRPLTPCSLLDTICWSISEPTSTACVYMDGTEGTVIEKGQSSTENANDASCYYLQHAEAVNGVTDGETLTRPLKESEKQEVIYRGVFLTILFPADRFGEMGPSARTYFSEGGFTCQQILEYIYYFYQDSNIYRK